MLLVLMSTIMFLFQVGCAKEDQVDEVRPPVQEEQPTDHDSSNPEGTTHTGNATAKLIERMSIDEKLGQLIFAGVAGTTLTDEIKELIDRYKVGGIILYANNMKDPTQSVELLNDLKSTNESNPLPLFLGVDQEGGRVSRLPGQMSKLPTNSKIGEINDPELSNEIGELLGYQLNAFGFNMNFAPVLDINSNPNNPVIGDRSFGSDPEVVSNLGIETMKGMQSQKVIPVIKHFPGHGDTADDSHLELPSVNKSIDELHHMELIPFRQAINSGADVVMIAHLLLPQLDATNPATLSHSIVTDLLRNDLDYEGVIITDDMTMQAITNHHDIGTAAVEAINAGNDIVMVAHDYKSIISAIDALKNAVQNGVLTEQRIDESLQRIIALKTKYELSNVKIERVDIENLNQQASNVLEKIK